MDREERRAQTQRQAVVPVGDVGGGLRSAQKGGGGGVKHGRSPSFLSDTQNLGCESRWGQCLAGSVGSRPGRDKGAGFVVCDIGIVEGRRRK